MNNSVNAQIFMFYKCYKSINFMYPVTPQKRVEPLSRTIKIFGEKNDKFSNL